MNRSPKTPVLTVAGTALAMALSAGAVVAQDDAAPHPAHIHSGTCVELGDVVIPLNDVAEPMGDRVGSEMATSPRISVTQTDAALSDITGAEHAVNVHLSADELGTYIACGEVGGTLTEDGTLAFRLHELTDSGNRGVAWLSGGDDGTSVTVLLWEDRQLMEAEGDS
jgi:hypothetical protein